MEGSKLEGHEEDFGSPAAPDARHLRQVKAKERDTGQSSE